MPLSRHMTALVVLESAKGASRVLLRCPEAAVERVRRHDRRGAGDLIVFAGGGRGIDRRLQRRAGGGGMLGVGLRRRCLRRRRVGTGGVLLGLDPLRLGRWRAWGSVGSPTADTDLAGQAGEPSVILGRRRRI